MNTKYIGIVILRIMGIYCLIEAFASAQGLLYVYTMPAEFSSEIPKMAIAYLAPSIMLLISGTLLITFSKRLVELITPKVDVEQTAQIYSLSDIQAILFSVAGVFIFSSSLPRAFTWISQLVTIIATDSQGLQPNPKIISDTWISLTLSSVQMLIGIGLFFGANKLSLYWHKMKKSRIE